MMQDGIVSSLTNYLARIQMKYNVACSFESKFQTIETTSKNTDITLYRVIVSIIEKTILSKVIESIHLRINNEPYLTVSMEIQCIPLLGHNLSKPLSSYLGFMGQLTKRIELSGGQLIIEDSDDNLTTEIRIQYD